MAKDKRLFLIDGMPLLYRGHFIFMRNPRVTSKGLNTSALYGLANSVLQIIEKEKPTHLALVFDTSEPTFRHRRYPDYKAHRDAMPEDIAKAIPLTHVLAAALRIPMLTCPGYEADDIIGTLAKRAEAEGFTTYMVTPDKDFAQLVTPHTLLYRPGKANEPPEIFGPDDVLARWGLSRVDQMIDLLGLAGDAADNIPGVPGIGEKTAQKLLQQFGSLDAALAGTDQLKGKQKENLEAFADQARLSRELATISVAAPVREALDELKCVEPDREKLGQLLREWEFVSLGKRLVGETFSLAADSGGTSTQGELAIGGGEPQKTKPPAHDDTNSPADEVAPGGGRRLRSSRASEMLPTRITWRTPRQLTPRWSRACNRRRCSASTPKRRGSTCGTRRWSACPSRLRRTRHSMCRFPPTRRRRRLCWMRFDPPWKTPRPSNVDTI